MGKRSRYQKNREDVARSLRELELLFGKRPPKDNALRAGKASVEPSKLTSRGAK